MHAGGGGGGEGGSGPARIELNILPLGQLVSHALCAATDAAGGL